MSSLLFAESGMNPPQATELRMVPSHRGNLALGACLMAAIALPEVATAYGAAVYGLIGDIFLLLGLLSWGSLLSDRTRARFVLALAIAPLIRVVSLGLPLSTMPQPFWYVATGLPLFVAGGVIARTLGLSPSDLGLRLPGGAFLLDHLGVVIAGLGIGFFEWQILNPPEIAHGPSILSALGVAVVLLVFTGFLEELLFRGLLQRVAIDFLGPNVGILCVALLFTVFHVGWHSPLDLLLVFGVGLFFGIVTRITGSIVGVSLAHGAINILLFLVLPLYGQGLAGL